ncbi:ATP-binding cassette domain-containing protein [Paraburkholderia sp. CNPSo 3155]|uniref:ABC transporter ATP-binding protein n=1 Tax=Paraburkholderia atlantica TaxID=2654982 RepID=UPI00128D06FA|nr:ABC transporter ATP-binding protein [Paraburkholderia atlantica]MPW09000.1 ATP-binding cassette domain-containing protein [Paraburkholderia atlantica]
MKEDLSLAVAHVSVSFGGVRALDDASLGLRAGRITGLVGPNGAGKSSLFNVLAGTLRPQRGAVTLGGRDIARLAVHARAHLGIGRTFQISRELDSLSVLENLLLAAPAQRGETITGLLFSRRSVRRAEERAIERALSLLARVRLTHLADEPAGVLSGGQKKLLELCRALMLEPSILLLDEPAAGVNPALIDELSAFILELRDEGMTFGIVEHNMEMMAALCDHVYVLAEGRVLTQGTFDAVTTDARVQEAYLGAAA